MLSRLLRIAYINLEQVNYILGEVEVVHKKWLILSYAKYCFESTL